MNPRHAGMTVAYTSIPDGKELPTVHNLLQSWRRVAIVSYLPEAIALWLSDNCEMRPKLAGSRNAVLALQRRQAFAMPSEEENRKFEYSQIAMRCGKLSDTPTATCIRLGTTRSRQ